MLLVVFIAFIGGIGIGRSLGRLEAAEAVKLKIEQIRKDIVSNNLVNYAIRKFEELQKEL